VGLIKGMDLTNKKDQLFLAITTYGGGAYISYDNGINWTIGNSGLKTTRLSDIKFSPQFNL
jgi:hypothetical protein